MDIPAIRIQAVSEGQPLWFSFLQSFPDQYAHVRKGCRWLAACTPAENVVGHVAFEFRSIGAGPLRNQAYARIRSLGVVDARRREGLGQKLLRALADVAEREGCVYLEARIPYETVPALRLFYKMGYSVVLLDDPDADPKTYAYQYGCYKSLGAGLAEK